MSSAALGLFIAPRALGVLIAWMAGRNQDSAFSATLDWRVLLFTVAAALIASLFFSLAPAVQFWNPRLAESLKQQTGTGSGGALQFRRTCVALQIGFSLLLIVGAGLFVRTIQNLRNVDPGFATDHLLTFGLAPEYAGYPANQIAPVEQRSSKRLPHCLECAVWEPPTMPISPATTSTVMSRCLDLKRPRMKITTSSFPG